MNTNSYEQQVKLLLRVLPFFVNNNSFALKGGTAINLFVRNMPRLSVDIDLTYLLIEKRELSLNNISQTLSLSSQKITSKFPEITIRKKFSKSIPERINKLFIKSEDCLIKVEPNEIIRGTVYPCHILDLCNEAQEKFEMFIKVNTLSIADLYGGKICAALDRQHPRDFFDLKILIENEGLTEKIRKAFLVYLISHNKPIHNLLYPNLLNMENIFNNEFQGMTTVPITYQDICQVRQNLIELLQEELTESERKFLLLFKEKNPDWKLLGIPGIENLPAVKWKLKNLEKMPSEKHLLYVDKLKEVLGF
jgi:predicted nucleotidyltransferase component of viral defense system